MISVLCLAWLAAVDESCLAVTPITLYSLEYPDNAKPTYGYKYVITYFMMSRMKARRPSPCLFCHRGDMTMCM